MTPIVPRCLVVAWKWFESDSESCVWLSLECRCERLLQLGVSGEMASVGLGELMSIVDESEPLWLIIRAHRVVTSVVLPAVSNVTQKLAERDEWSTYGGEGAPWHLTSQSNLKHRNMKS